MAESPDAAREVALTLEVMLGGGYRATDRRHGVQTTGRTDHDALRRLHTWLEQRGLANSSTLYQIRRFGNPGSVREEREYSLRSTDFIAPHRPSAR